LTELKRFGLKPVKFIMCIIFYNNTKSQLQRETNYPLHINTISLDT